MFVTPCESHSSTAGEVQNLKQPADHQYPGAHSISMMEKGNSGILWKG